MAFSAVFTFIQDTILDIHSWIHVRIQSIVFNLFYTWLFGYKFCCIFSFYRNDPIVSLIAMTLDWHRLWDCIVFMLLWLQFGVGITMCLCVFFPCLAQDRCCTTLHKCVSQTNTELLGQQTSEKRHNSQIHSQQQKRCPVLHK